MDDSRDRDGGAASSTHAVDRAPFPGHDPEVTTYFTGKADRYARYRPDYPAAAVALVLERCAANPLLADIGCGTGISTRAFAAGGAGRIIGIEPNDDMRAAAMAHDTNDPRIGYILGTAEATGLPDESVDAVICAQSFHWFDGEPSLREFHRVTRPGGVLALLWNMRPAHSSGASSAYERIIDRAQEYALSLNRRVRHYRSGDPTTGGWFRDPIEQEIPNPVSYTLEELLGRAHSASYFPESGEMAEELDGELRVLFERFQEHGRVTIDQVCSVTIAKRADRP